MFSSSTTAVADEVVSLPQSTKYILLGMFMFGVLGMMSVAAITAHTMYHFRREKLNTGWARVLYASFFTAYFITCVAYTFFKTDLVLPMGTSIDCRLGVYLTTNAVFFSKFLLFLVFVFRIDIAFHNSALAYSRTLLVVIVVTYALWICAGNAAYIYTTLPAVRVLSYEFGVIGIDHIDICFVEIEQVTGSLFGLILGSLILGDMLYSIVVCALFVYKLNIVVKMDKTASSKDNRLKKVIKKQTILVVIAALSSLFLLGLSSAGSTLLMPLDAMINTLCVWLMFNFSDAVWNKIVHRCCFCLQCCKCKPNKEQFLMTLHSMRSMLSSRSMRGIMDVRSASVRAQNAVPSNGVTPSVQKKLARTPAETASPRDIPISFDNANLAVVEHKKHKSGTSMNDLDVPLTSDDDDGIVITYDESKADEAPRSDKLYAIEMEQTVTKIQSRFSDKFDKNKSKSTTPELVRDDSLEAQATPAQTPVQK